MPELCLEIDHDLFLSLLSHQHSIKFLMCYVVLSNLHMLWFSDKRSDQELICLSICHGEKEGKIKICN